MTFKGGFDQRQASYKESTPLMKWLTLIKPMDKWQIWKGSMILMIDAKLSSEAKMDQQPELKHLRMTVQHLDSPVYGPTLETLDIRLKLAFKRPSGSLHCPSAVLGVLPKLRKLNFEYKGIRRKVSSIYDEQVIDNQLFWKLEALPWRDRPVMEYLQGLVPSLLSQSKVATLEQLVSYLGRLLNLLSSSSWTNLQCNCRRYKCFACHIGGSVAWSGFSDLNANSNGVSVPIVPLALICLFVLLINCSLCRQFLLWPKFWEAWSLWNTLG